MNAAVEPKQLSHSVHWPHVGFLHSKGKRTSAIATIAEIHDSKWLRVSAGPGLHSHAVECKARMRVVPDGQPEFDSELHLLGGDVQRLPVAGRQTYVLYDPEHPEHCEIDHGRLLKEFGPRNDGKPNMAIPSKVTRATGGGSSVADQLMAQLGGGARSLRVSGSVPRDTTGSADSLERLQKLGDLHDRGVLTDAEFAAEKAKILNPS